MQPSITDKRPIKTTFHKHIRNYGLKGCFGSSTAFRSTPT